MSVVQGLDTMPREVLEETEDLFDRLLPGWSNNGAYNFQPAASTQKAAAQLCVLVENGSHPWINNQIIALLNGSEFEALGNEMKTARLI